MVIKATDFIVDEDKSNPMVIAVVIKDCPIKEVCSFLKVGFGTVLKTCEHFKEKNEDEAECTYK